jgi:hypothetical protein
MAAKQGGILEKGAVEWQSGPRLAVVWMMQHVLAGSIMLLDVRRMK